MKLSIVMVSYNAKDLIVECLETIKKFLDLSEVEVIVVDNASSDGTVEVLRSKHDWVKLIENKENIGFGRANNQGARASRGEYLWFLNGDTLLLDDGIMGAIEWMDDYDEAGVLSPKLILEDKKTIQEGICGKQPSIARLIKRDMMTECGGRAQGVGWVTGAAMLVRKKIFEEVGGFDERFFMYYEDVDLCTSVGKKGYKVFYWPKTVIVHLGGKSWNNNWQRKESYYKNQEIYFKKHYGFGGALLMKLIRWPYKVKVKREMR